MTGSARPAVALLPAHPAQVWMLNALAQTMAEWAGLHWYLRDKDVSRPLADALGIRYRPISVAGRGLVGNALEMAAAIGRVVRETRANRIDCWISKYGAANLGARLAGATSIAFNDDDYDLVPLIAWTSYPFASAVLAPEVTRMGPFTSKTLRFAGFKELFYLHPHRFRPDPEVFGELGLAPGSAYALIRLSALAAHHDRGITGLSDDFLAHLIASLQPDVTPIVSSEKPLAPRFERFRMRLPVHRVHHALAFATCLASDSQSMSTEAAVLGTPSLRLNGFVGRISSMAELDGYGLSFGFRPAEEGELLLRLRWVLGLGHEERRNLFCERRRRLLADKPDPVPFAAAAIRSLVVRATTMGAARPEAGQGP